MYNIYRLMQGAPKSLRFVQGLIEYPHMDGVIIG